MDKFTRALDLIGNHFSGDILINHSPANGYRSRCEFGYKNGFMGANKSGTGFDLLGGR